MQLNYTITQEHYEDVIAFQLKLQRSKRRSLIQYIVTNAIFIILAVYFLVTHPESSVWSRLGVMGWLRRCWCLPRTGGAAHRARCGALISATSGSS